MDAPGISYPDDFQEAALALFGEGTDALAVARVSLRKGSTAIGALIGALIPEEGGVSPHRVIDLCERRDLDGLRAASAEMRVENDSPIAQLIHPGEGVTPDQVDQFLADGDLDGLVARAREILKARELWLRFIQLASGTTGK